MKFTTVIKYKIKENNEYLIEKETTLDDNINSYEDFVIIRSGFGSRSKMFIRPKRDILLISAIKTARKHYNKKDFYFLNGYQSNTDSFQYAYGDKLYYSNKIEQNLLDKCGDAHFYQYQKNVLHAFDISYIKGINELFVGSLDYKHAYLIIEYHIKKDRLYLKSDVYNQECLEGIDFKLFDYVIANRIDEGVHEYVKYFEPRNKHKIFGYYTYFKQKENIDETSIMASINNSHINGSITQLDLFQIGAGYQTFVGDWLDVDIIKFPNGLDDIVSSIHEHKMKAGIWLAPFVCEEKSKVFNDHYDWIKKDESGNPYKCSNNYSGLYVLDLNNNEVKKYIKSCLEKLMEMGFDYFTLDYLFVTNIGYSDGLSRCTYTHNAYSFLHSILKEKLINANKACIINGIDNFDYMRISPDISMKFNGDSGIKYREKGCTKNTTLNTVFRSFLNKHLFMNNPDIFIIKKDNNKLSLKQKEALLMINALYSSVLMTSDDISNYNEEERKILDKALYVFYNAYDIDFYRMNKNEIKFFYSIKDSNYAYVYNINKGTMKFLKSN